MAKATVAVVRKMEQETMRDTIRRAVDMIGGFSRFVKRGNTVLVKPNLIGGEPVPGTMTDPTVVKAVCDLAYEAGASRIIVGDSCHVGGDTTDYAKTMGFLDILKGTPYEFVHETDQAYFRGIFPGIICHPHYGHGIAACATQSEA